MQTYLVNLLCSFPALHRVEDGELFVTVHAESPEHIEQPLRSLLTELQHKEGFHKVEVLFITCVPPEKPAIVFSNERWKNGGVFVESHDEWLEPAWYKKLLVPQTSQEDGAHYAALVKFARERGDKPPEWDGKESLGHNVEPFMVFPNVVVKLEHQGDD